MWLTFLGAAGTVTGSKHLVEYEGTGLLVDCGMYQGERDLRRRNWKPLGTKADQLAGVAISHTHLDHVGWLPRLVRQGFHGPVWCSPQTAELAAIVLRDAAHLQEEDAEYAARIGSSRHRPPKPLYTTGDAEKAIALFEPIPFGKRIIVDGDMALRLHRAGHILGSSTVEVTARGRSALFSGDLGRPGHPLLAPPDPPPAVNTVVVESTYGDRSHPPQRLDRFAEVLSRGLGRAGVVVIPAFAVDRTEMLLMALGDLMRSGQVPTVPVYVDSPMALAALEVYRRAVAAAAPDIRPGLTGVGDLFDPGLLHTAHSVEESKRLNDAQGPCIIVSAAGMATGGRVLHHLAHLLPQERNLVLLPGFQVAGTRGRQLLDGATSVKIYGEYVPVRAEVVGIEDFSSHADADEILAWLRQIPQAPQACYIVHGEPGASEVLAERIRTELGWSAVIPRLSERVRA